MISSVEFGTRKRLWRLGDKSSKVSEQVTLEQCRSAVRMPVGKSGDGSTARGKAGRCDWTGPFKDRKKAEGEQRRVRAEQGQVTQASWSWEGIGPCSDVTGGSQRV